MKSIIWSLLYWIESYQCKLHSSNQLEYWRFEQSDRIVTLLIVWLYQCFALFYRGTICCVPSNSLKNATTSLFLKKLPITDSLTQPLAQKHHSMLGVSGIKCKRHSIGYWYKIFTGKTAYIRWFWYPRKKFGELLAGVDTIAGYHINVIPGDKLE